MSALASKTSTIIPFKPRHPAKPRTLPREDQPRQRLRHLGGATLSDAELLSLVLSRGKTLDHVEHAQNLLYDLGGLPGLLTASQHDLNSLKPARRTRLLAAIELAHRLARSRMPRRDLLNSPQIIASYLFMKYARSDQEVMGALYLDVRHRLITEHELYRGTLNKLTVDPRAILIQGLQCSAYGFVLWHTHPSCDPTPSPEDVVFTRRMVDAGDLLNVKLLDHMILASAGRWTSLKHSDGAW